MGVAARNGRPDSESVHAEEPVRYSYPQLEVGRTMVGEVEESPSSSLVDGRYFAPSALPTSGMRLLADVLPQDAAPLDKLPPAMQLLMVALSALLAPSEPIASAIDGVGLKQTLH